MIEQQANALFAALCASKSVLLTGPLGLDGDSVGACLALQNILEARGIPSVVAGIPSYRYDWMPQADRMVPDVQLRDDYDAVVVMDGDRHRLTPQALRAFNNARVKAIVDHHGSTRTDGYTHWWLQPDIASTCQMLYQALDGWGVSLSKDLASHLYTGTIFDTGGFRYSNTTPETHRMGAALLSQGIQAAEICNRVLIERSTSSLRLAGHVFSNATLHLDGQLAVGRATLDLKHRFKNVDGDLEGIVDRLVHIIGVKVAFLLVERESGDVKYSLRSRGAVNMADVARELSQQGGGHPKAAGATVRGPIDKAERDAIRIIARLMP